MMRTALISLLFVLAGCAGSQPPAMSATEAAQSAYLLDSGDKLRVTVFGEQRLTAEYSIASTGAVAFPLIGTVPAKGLSTDQLAQAITTRLSAGYITDPKVAVEVVTYRPYYIFGEVSRPGEYAFVNGRTVEQAIAAAGGYTYRGSERRVTVRRGAQGQRLVTRDMFVARVLPGDTIRVGERYF